MFKKVTKITLASVLGLSLMGLPVADAAKAPYKTNVKVEFEENTEGTKPLNPENPDPENPINPQEPEEADREPVPQGGGLIIDYVSDFDFGKVQKNGNTKSYPAKARNFEDSQGNKILLAPYAQVTDNSGNDQGWKLKVEMKEQLTTPSGAELKGASLDLVEGVLNSSNRGNIDFVESKAVTLTPGQSGVVIDASEGVLGATYTNVFGEVDGEHTDGVLLNVPGASIIEDDSYATELEWTIENAK